MNFLLCLTKTSKGYYYISSRQYRRRSFTWTVKTPSASLAARGSNKNSLYPTTSIRSTRSVLPTTRPSHLTSCPTYCISSVSYNAGPVLCRRIYRRASAVSMNTASRSLLLPFPYAPCVTRPHRAVTRIGCVELMAISSALMIDAVVDDAPV